MRLVTLTHDDTLEVNWMWLPTFLGMNPTLRAELQELLLPLRGSSPEEALDRGHTIILDHIKSKLSNFDGLDDYFDGLRFVHPKE